MGAIVGIGEAAGEPLGGHDGKVGKIDEAIVVEVGGRATRTNGFGLWFFAGVGAGGGRHAGVSSTAIGAQVDAAAIGIGFVEDAVGGVAGVDAGACLSGWGMIP